MIILLVNKVKYSDKVTFEIRSRPKSWVAVNVKHLKIKSRWIIFDIIVLLNQMS